MQKENIPQSNNKGIMAYDGVVAELNVEYKFKKPELMNEFRGSIIKIYHSVIALDNEFNFIGQTEEYVDNDLLFKKRFKMFYCFQKLQIIKVEIDIAQNIQELNTSLGNILVSKNYLLHYHYFIMEPKMIVQ